MARRKRRPTPSPLGWAFFLLFALITLLVTLWVLRPLKERQTKNLTEEPRPKPKKFLKVQKAPEPLSKKKPLACIIIDDMGQNPRLEREFFTLGLVLNFSFLPEGPYTKRLATEAHARGFEVLVHLPLQALKGRDASSFISLRMDQIEVKRRVKEAVKKVPYAIGINHHMGSAFSADWRHMRWVLEEAKALGLFYVDSRTTKKTVVPVLAKELGLPFAERRVFLDHQMGLEAVSKALDKLIWRAKKVGPTLAIGHPHPNTLRALKNYRSKLREEVTLVPISVFIRKVNGYDQTLSQNL